MPQLVDFAQAVEAYRDRKLSLDEFVDWFHSASRSRFAEGKQVREVCFAIDAALSELSFGGVSERAFLQELENAIRPFVPSATENKSVQLRDSEPRFVSGADAVQFLEAIAEVKTLIDQANRWAAEAEKPVRMPVKRESSVAAKATYGTSATLLPQLVAQPA